MKHGLRVESRPASVQRLACKTHMERILVDEIAQPLQAKQMVNCKVRAGFILLHVFLSLTTSQKPEVFSQLQRATVDGAASDPPLIGDSRDLRLDSYLASLLRALGGKLCWENKS